jgi:hypothetical protein
MPMRLVAMLPRAEQHGAIGQRGYDVATRKPVTPKALSCDSGFKWSDDGICSGGHLGH